MMLTLHMLWFVIAHDLLGKAIWMTSKKTLYFFVLQVQNGAQVWKFCGIILD